MTQFKFSVGPWNVHTGADAYGPATRKDIPIEEKFKKFAEIGFSAIQFHDDDAVPNINDYTEEEIKEKARELKKTLDKYNLKAEFVAPRLWIHEHIKRRPGIRNVESIPFHRYCKRTWNRHDCSVACKRRHTVCRIKITSMGNQNAD